MSDPNTMPAPAPVMEEKKRSEEFLELYKRNCSDEMLAQFRPGFDLTAYNQYVDTSDLLYNQRPGYVRPMVHVDSVKTHLKETKYSGLPEAKMSFKDRQKKKLLDFRERKSWTDVDKVRHDYLLSVKDIYDPTEEVKEEEETQKQRPSDEDIQEVLSKTYYPEALFGASAFTDHIESTTLIMNKMRAVMEYIRPGTPYYENAPAVVKAKILYRDAMFKKMNECFQNTLTLHNVKMENGKLVELPELEGRFDTSRTNPWMDSLAELRELAQHPGLKEELNYKWIMQENLKKRKEDSRSEFEKGTKKGRCFETPFGMVATEKQQNTITAFLAVIDVDEFKENVSKSLSLIQVMLTTYINNSKIMYDIELEKDAIETEATVEASKMDTPNVSMEEITKGLHYSALLKQKKAMLQNLTLAYEHANSLLSEILDKYILMNAPGSLSDDAKKYLAEAGYTYERDVIQQKVTQARVYSDTVNGSSLAFEEALLRRFPLPEMEIFRQTAKANYLKTAHLGLMKPGNPEYNDYILDMVLKRSEANSYGQTIAEAEKNGMVLDQRFVAQQNQLMLETSYATETIVSAEVNKLMGLNMEFFVYDSTTIAQRLPELTPLYLQLSSMRMMFNWDTDVKGYTILDRALNKPVPYLEDLDKDEYQRQMDAYKKRHTEFFDRMDMLEGLTLMARGKSMAPAVIKYGHYTEWMAEWEYQLFKKEGDDDIQVMTNFCVELEIEAAEKYLKASDRVLRRMKEKEEPAGSKAD